MTEIVVDPCVQVIQVDRVYRGCLLALNHPTET
jgi:hypothetical protein